MTNNNVLSVVEIFCNEILANEKVGISDWVQFSRKLHLLYDQHVKKELHDSGRVVACRLGCSLCCSHWVEDVYSFESLALVDYITKEIPHRIKRIVIEAHGAILEFSEICETFPELTENELLLKFYQLQIPCPLLDENGECMVYPVRPLTCRSYYSRDFNRFCEPTAQDSEPDGTFMLQFPEYLEELLDAAHFRLDSEEVYPTALRSVLVMVDSLSSIQN